MANDPADYLDPMQDLVGISAAHKALGEAIALNLHKWLSTDTLLLGFDDVIAPALTENAVRNQPTAARFLLMLAGRPGYILDWPKADRNYLLERMVTSPVLLRAARYAVLGTRILNDEQVSIARLLMKLSTLTAQDASVLAVQTLGLDPELIDLTSTEGLAASLRRAASFMCPTSPSRLIDAVLDAVRPVSADGVRRTAIG